MGRDLFRNANGKLRLSSIVRSVVAVFSKSSATSYSIGGLSLGEAQQASDYFDSKLIRDRCSLVSVGVRADSNTGDCFYEAVFLRRQG